MLINKIKLKVKPFKRNNYDVAKLLGHPVARPKKFCEARWQLAAEYRPKPGRTVSPSTYGTFNFWFKLSPVKQALAFGG